MVVTSNIGENIDPVIINGFVLKCFVVSFITTLSLASLSPGNVVMFPDNDPLHSIFTSPLVKYNLDPERVRTSLVFTESFFNLKLESVNDDLYLSIVM